MQGNALSCGSVLHGNQYNYIIEKVLGQGTFGITYLAKVSLQGQLGQLDSNVFVTIKEFFMKEINGREGTNVTSSSNSKGGLFYDYKEKFAREAKNLSKLKHPNIVNVMDYFEANNTCYYVMEYLSGGDLDALIEKRSGLGEEDTIRFTKQIGSALSFMHKNKMLHLDLKPKNVMLNADGNAILIDFGLSKQYDSSGEPESSTTVGRGTPGYAPLEQANYQDGHGFPVTMDVYALGATMYKMITGIRAPEASVILNEGFSISRLFEEYCVSIDLLEIIKKSMSPIKKDRYQTIDELINNLPYQKSINNEETISKVNNTKKKTNLEKQLKNRDLEPSKTEFISKDTRGENKEKFIWNKIVERVCRMDRTTRFLVPLIVGVVFAIIAYNTWAMNFGGPDSDGILLRTAFYIVSLILIPIVIFWKKEDNIKIIQCGIFCFTLSIINSCLLRIWNSSLVDAYYVLSFCLAFLSAFMLSKKASKEEMSGEQKDQIKVISQITDTLKQANSNKKKISNVKDHDSNKGTKSPMSIFASGCLSLLLVPVAIGISALYNELPMIYLIIKNMRR